jgi:hypothetical protein
MANVAVNTFSPTDVKFIFGGYTVVGWDGITISRSSQGFTPVRGIRGKHSRTRTRDTSATITITLIQSSPSNDVLSQVHAMDLVEGTGRLAISLVDKSGRSKFSSNEAYILGYPESKYSGSIEYRVWTIYCQTTDTYIVGGNDKPETTLVDSLVSGISGIAGNIF